MITDVAGIRVGHWTDPIGRTGCTVVLPPPGTVASGEVRGGAPGTRETDLLRPGMLVQHADAILLSGGSAFGLAAADGVVRWLEEDGRGVDAGVARVPIVPAAVLFDLGVGDPGARPDAAAGYAAAAAAGTSVEEGQVGAGTGATVGTVAGPERAVPGGIGSAARAAGGVTVGAIAAVNAYGVVVDDEGAPIAGALPADGSEGWTPFRPPPATNTTLAVVATDARLSRERAHLLAVAAHDALARAIEPSHTMWDGDTIFTLATGATEGPQDAIERLAEAALVEAIRRAVTAEGRRR
ncbi:MAG TPA: P1 family peptidase [Actinomycetota bacterium]|nr:P1 family peptidase [Actinomycetota bacterium]